MYIMYKYNYTTITYYADLNTGLCTYSFYTPRVILENKCN